GRLFQHDADAAARVERHRDRYGRRRGDRRDGRQCRIGRRHRCRRRAGRRPDLRSGEEERSGLLPARLLRGTAFRELTAPRAPVRLIRHCEERSDEATQGHATSACRVALGCFPPRLRLAVAMTEFTGSDRRDLDQPTDAVTDLRRAAASITATAHDASRDGSESARLVSMIGTRAPSTMPAASAWARNDRLFASMLPASRSGTTSTFARPATGEESCLIAAAFGLIA